MGKIHSFFMRSEEELPPPPVLRRQSRRICDEPGCENHTAYSREQFCHEHKQHRPAGGDFGSGPIPLTRQIAVNDPFDFFE